MFREEHLAWSTCNIAVQAFRFFYHTTLGRPELTFTIPGPKQPKTLPVILSQDEVRRVIESTVNRKQRALLATMYAASLRVSEVVRLELEDIDAQRMSLRIVMGDPLVPKQLDSDLKGDSSTEAPLFFLARPEDFGNFPR